VAYFRRGVERFLGTEIQVVPRRPVSGVRLRAWAPRNLAPREGSPHPCLHECQRLNVSTTKMDNPFRSRIDRGAGGGDPARVCVYLPDRDRGRRHRVSRLVQHRHGNPGAVTRTVRPRSTSLLVGTVGQPKLRAPTRRSPSGFWTGIRMCWRQVRLVAHRSEMFGARPTPSASGPVDVDRLAVGETSSRPRNRPSTQTPPPPVPHHSYKDLRRRDRHKRRPTNPLRLIQPPSTNRPGLLENPDPAVSGA